VGGRLTRSIVDGGGENKALILLSLSAAPEEVWLRALDDGDSSGLEKNEPDIELLLVVPGVIILTCAVEEDANVSRRVFLVIIKGTIILVGWIVVVVLGSDGFCGEDDGVSSVGAALSRPGVAMLLLLDGLSSNEDDDAASSALTTESVDCIRLLSRQAKNPVDEEEVVASSAGSTVAVSSTSS
jgi:hypothetical protein